MTFRTRFAPSPTGPLHLGHAFSALTAHDMARAARGEFLLRIDDLDRERSRPEWEALIFEDLEWLGLRWPRPVMHQSGRMARYAGALEELWAAGLLYPCRCSRRDIREAASAPQEGAPATGPDGIVYPGTCRPAPGAPRPARAPQGCALRLDLRAAFERVGSAVAFTETGAGPDGQQGEIRLARDEAEATIGDVVLARRGMGGSYHLSVVLDDADQGITHVVRGRDLFEATKIHALLQRLLGLPAPLYHHHRLIRDEAGKRLAKRDEARAVRSYRAAGASPADIREMLGLPMAPVKA